MRIVPQHMPLLSANEGNGVMVYSDGPTEPEAFMPVAYDLEAVFQAYKFCPRGWQVLGFNKTIEGAIERISLDKAAVGQAEEERAFAYGIHAYPLAD